MRRPEGTDGSDHGYRETVEAAYKGAPIWRAAGWLFLHATAIPTFLRVGWAVVPYYTLRQYPQIAPFILLAMYLAALTFWSLAKPATSRENLLFVKLTNVMMVFGTGLHCMTVYKYHIMDTKQSHYSRRIAKYLRDEEGWTAGYWVSVFEVLEALLDGGAAILWGGTAYCLHAYITRKMVMAKKLEEGKKARGVAEQPKLTAPTPPGRRRAART